MPQMHEVDYKIVGEDLQFVEVELDPEEAVVAEAGGMMYMDDGVAMETVFGDGGGQAKGFLGGLMGAGKRLLTGEFFERARAHPFGERRRGVLRLRGIVAFVEECHLGYGPTGCPLRCREAS